MQNERSLRWLSVVFLLSSILVGSFPFTSDAVIRPSLQGQYRLEEVARGISFPVLATHAGDGSGRLFIVSQRGQIHILKDGVLLQRPFLDIRTLVSCCGERGLLGLSFHPSYEQNGYFFIYYTDLQGDIIIARYRVSSDPDVAEPQEDRRLLRIAHRTYPNHNGGHIAFGPDGYLYIAVGDGGGAGDPFRAGQDVNTYLGKILRVDVDGQAPYAIPPTNPFVNKPGLDEIWAYGLRNPWRFSFDRETGDLYIGDVGQNALEEIDFEPAGSPGGLNYGWSVMEGSRCFRPSTNCNQTGLTLPIHEYAHPPRRCASVTGGYVYRGRQLPELVGTYIFGDYCLNTIWGLTRNADGQWTQVTLLEPLFQGGLSSFGEDEDGELYVIDIAQYVYRLVAAR